MHLVSDSRESALAERPTLAMVSRRDFERARAQTALAPCRDYRDFLEERDARFFGYGSAGVSVCFQRIPLAAFGRWVALTGASTTLASLDHFAAHWLWRSRHPEARSVGHRASRGPIGARRVHEGGVQVVEVFGDGFADWRDALVRLRLFPTPPAVDAYAALVVETCIASGQRSGLR